MNTIFLVVAQSELDDAIDYYEDQSSGLGFEFADEVEHALARINHYPQAWSSLSSRVRRCLVKRFPYLVIYEIRGESIVVVAIQHHHQKPENWRTRIIA
jgi:plasmid stabilization system protein ParE